ncbi:MULTISPECIES: GntR family transcriptional regulator [Streptomyces]|jgi:DNA-binding GntR family transcriptional regulator|uniref:GntR family transcriptional regulator n=3 Tax=Streptomyces griseoaurantiacus TaxID=68213 RepID=F3NHP2_9ACTN|nr:MULTISPECIES: GntR family transcriptional regulator [Streptomyces]EGG46932.1 GntR family transcriptional regulator [Streptomyces griseoaurantiacus M045]MBA5225565.1 GntR family transcriptional regulator [Streptomyces griseoaurantiacus]MCF0089781.1 HTH-type transcriptional repressor RspR [Streptomyces sp. MH192]MCF0102881.1 HTH-type transcriptional repressor RspR [Streptomyces sp. MH191]MDX3092274.1 GntR family transcriptional regulator [Streptomyces sp. ME12-02E]
MPNEARPGTGEQAKQLALAKLRQAILRGEMAPAQRLVENELAEEFGVTRASIRAALIDLASEGLVERIRNRGSRVRVVSVEEAVAITECRMVLEGLCAAKAAVMASEEQLTGLAELGEAMTKAVAAGEPLTYSELNAELHSRILRISGQQVAVELLDRLNAQLVRHRFQLALRPGRPQQSLNEHLAMVEAIRARDPQAADAAVRAHLSSVIEAYRHE